MDYYWTLFKNSTTTNGSNTTTSNGVRGHNGNCTTTGNDAWESCSWELIGNDSNNGGGGGNSRLEYSNYPPHGSLDYTPTGDRAAAGSFHSPATQVRGKSAGRHFRNPDPHLTCLKLGKRHYFEDVAGPDPMAELHIHNMTKKGKTYRGPPVSPLVVGDVAQAVVPRCQVEECESVLVNAKDYHRRHKVCEMHAKAPRVVVHGVEQRFCQQCSRFHAVAEFDEWKRSCRRRLAGHNERRRKGSQEQHSLARKQFEDPKMMDTGRHPHFMNNTECALSLLSSSSSYNPSWNISPPSEDLPARCSAALRELIAENRASVLACRQLINSNHMENCNNNTCMVGSNRSGLGPSVSGGHVTLDLMQDPDSAFGLLSVHDHKAPKEGNGEDCSELWKIPLGY